MSDGQPLCLRFFQSQAFRPACPANDLGVGFGLNFAAWTAKQLFKGDIAAFDGMVGIENKNAIRSRIKQGIQTLFFVTDLPVEAGIEDRNGGLVGEGLQKLLVVGGK